MSVVYELEDLYLGLAVGYDVTNSGIIGYVAG